MHAHPVASHRRAASGRTASQRLRAPVTKLKLSTATEGAVGLESAMRQGLLAGTVGDSGPSRRAGLTQERGGASAQTTDS